MRCEGEIMQAIARSRYVRQPVKILILNRTPLPLRIDRVVPIEQLDPEWRKFETSSVFPLSQNEYKRLWPGIFKDGRTATRITERDARIWADEKLAFQIEYRLRGSRGPKKRALVETIEAVSDLGDVVEWDFVECEHNDFVIYAREMRDMLAREPFEDLDAEDTDAVQAFNVGGKEIWLPLRRSWPAQE
jgi:hypothetical protein